MDSPAVGAAPATTMPASRSGPVTSSGGGIFSRPRTTAGLSTLRSAPVPSALFEAPTAADIDKALLALEEKGPTPSMPAPPPPPPVAVAPATNVGDDEPTKVFDVAAQEFAVHEAVTGQTSALRDSAVPVATDGTGDDLTAKREVEPSEPVPAIGQSAPMMGSLDAPLAAHLDGSAPLAAPAATTGRRDTPASAAAAAAAAAAAVPMKIVVDQPGRSIESGRFRSDAKYRRSSRKSGKIVVAVLLAGVAAAGVVFGKREYDKRKAAAIATAPAPAEIAAPVPPPPPPPAPDNTGAAPSPPAPPAEAKPETPTVAAPAKTPETATAPPKPDKGKGDKAAGEKSAEERPTKSGRRKSAASAEAAAVPSPDKTDKPAATPPAGEKAPAEAAAAGGAAAEAPKTAEAAPAEKPVLKITSSPTGAEVVIDGSSVGTTPYSSKDVDPTAAHAITVRKDGFEAHERMISGSDWTKARSGAQSLKMNIKLKRTGPSEAAPPKDEGKASDVEVLTPSEP